MSRTVGTLVAATFVCGSASAYLWQELRTEREQTQTLQARVAQLEQATRQPIASLPTPREFLPPPENVTQPASQSSAAPKNSPSTVAAQAGWTAVGAPGSFAAVGGSRMDPEVQRRIEENFEQQRRLLQDPEYRSLMRDQQKLNLKRMYADMELMLGVSKEEAEHILDVLAEQQLRSMERHKPFMPKNGNAAPDEAAMREQQRVFEDMRRTNEAELSAALGSRYRDWQEYQQTMGARQQVMSLRQTLASSSEPMREDQIKPLVQAIARDEQAAQRMPPITRSVPGAQVANGDTLRMQEEWLERRTQSHERIRNAVSSLLTPSQMQQLEEQQEQERKSLELSIRTTRARIAEAEARGETPGNQANMLGVSNALIVN
jgi:hypothetical protein